MTTDEQAALGRIVSEISSLRAEMLGRFDRHEARHDALDDASRARQMTTEHRVTVSEAGVTELRRDVCELRRVMRQRTVVGSVLVALGAGGAWLAQQVGLGKPGP